MRSQKPTRFHLIAGFFGPAVRTATLDCSSAISVTGHPQEAYIKDCESRNDEEDDYGRC